ncbi:FtsQ-type POTRA domain-containing protein [Aggregicoccus sp. 17bor-14]|uniref:cell division protein FtsQ/DivIB n=1 Tax=Myxococcaceae TaxID=31 RepID=UPI00129C6B53|nr:MULTISPECIES: FtsQ-type POTRA domain-containing protein [Myxococcaceae]MBF5044416.1 FtsQ-type POTRA domain-containing protein [Simulacricoccus sp. 17bor-14]MRI90163.1 FtsQ-type POTRA domain-containing protein [Aggregicoccus sp. 17bor-14]
MAFGRAKNRRRQDAAQTRAAVQGAVRTHAPTVLRALLTAALTVGLVWSGVALRAWALASPTFALQEVTFTGLARAGRPELLKLSGLAPGQNLFSLDVDQLERSLMAHPWVRAVEVTRHFPAAVSVVVEEHVPVALVVLGDLYVLDEQGEPFKRVAPSDALDLPLVTGVDREAYVADEAHTRARFRQALEVARAYAAASPSRRERLSEVRLTGDALTLVSATGQEVPLGEGMEAEQLAQKLARLEKVRGELAERGLSAEVIHLDNRARPGWVAVKLSGAGSERTGTATQ